MITGNYLSMQYAIIYNLYSDYNEVYVQCSVIFNNCSPWRQIVVDIFTELQSGDVNIHQLL